MTFFEHQDRARRKTYQLFFFFSLALGILIGGIYLIARSLIAWIRMSEATLFSYRYMERSSHDQSWWATIWQWDPELFWWVTLLTLLIVTLGSIYKTIQLRAGGIAVALSLGARLIPNATSDPKERQLLNVVVEMAIASGTPAPPVYLLEGEEGINAFAAGYHPDDAIIGVTQGCLDQLSREELQGIIAHEFSHILNGDIRLNLHLTSLIHGILVIGLTGEILVRSTSRRRSGFRVNRLSGKTGKEGPALMILGLALMAVGYLGVCVGNLIKAAVSRQREFLADASATQFTRNPTGLAKALKKIGGFGRGSIIRDPHSQTVSHMFFSQAFKGGLSQLFATHPSLVQRIKRLDPTFRGQFQKVKPPSQETSSTAENPQEPAISALVSETPHSSPPPTDRVDPVEGIGHPSEFHLRYARQLLSTLPQPLLHAAQDPYGARALMYSILMHHDDRIREQQVDTLRDQADSAVYRETICLTPLTLELPDEARLPLIDMSLPSLRTLSGTQYLSFKKNVNLLIHADQHLEMFEWAMRQVLLRHLEPSFRKVSAPRVQFYSLKRLGPHCSTLLSALAYQNSTHHSEVLRAFSEGAGHLVIAGLTLHPLQDCSIPVLDHSLEILQHVAMKEKRKLLGACAATVLAINPFKVSSGELLRAIADSLGCPMPPLMGRTPRMQSV